MEYKKISAEQAEILFNSDSYFVPFRELNKMGKNLVAGWVSETAKTSLKHNIKAWYRDAEDAANSAGLHGSIIIEMRGHMTKSGNPVTLDIPQSAFDWFVAVVPPTRV